MIADTCYIYKVLQKAMLGGSRQRDLTQFLRMGKLRKNQLDTGFLDLGSGRRWKGEACLPLPSTPPSFSLVWYISGHMLLSGGFVLSMPV